MRTDRVEQIPLAVMQRQAISMAEDYVDQGIRFQYQEVAAASVRKYIAACQGSFLLTPLVRSQYEDEVRRYLLAEGSRRGWPVG